MIYELNHSSAETDLEFLVLAHTLSCARLYQGSLPLIVMFKVFVQLANNRTVKILSDKNCSTYGLLFITQFLTLFKYSEMKYFTNEIFYPTIKMNQYNARTVMRKMNTRKII